MRKGYTFDDVCIVPQYNNVPSRTTPDLSTWLTKDTPLNIPIVCANMDTTISEDLAEILLGYGSWPIFHRFYKNKQDLVNLVDKFDNACYISCGVDALEVDKLMSACKSPPRGVVVDIAHGHGENILRTIDYIKKTYADLEVIGGNVCTAQGYTDLVNAGADAVKVGVGGGSVCQTRLVTGCGVPQFTAVQDCAAQAKKLRVPVISDGAIRSSADIMKALAAGASSAMIGRLFAETKEAAGKGTYRGQASKHFQDDFFGKVKEGTVPEGVDVGVDIHRSAADVVEELLGGIRSGMTYCGSKNISELQRKAEFMEVTLAYQTESETR